MQLSKSFDESFLDLAKTLHDLKETDTNLYRDFAKNSALGSRKAFYLIALHKAFKNTKVSRKTSLSWAGQS